MPTPQARPALPPDDPGGEAPPHALDLLWRTIEARRGADPASSYTAALLARFPAKPAQKLAEEAAECAIEAVRGDAEALVRESADLLFHLLVLLAGAGVAPGEVYAELMAREAVAAKPRRQVRSLGTRKIP